MKKKLNTWLMNMLLIAVLTVGCKVSRPDGTPTLNTRIYLKGHSGYWVNGEYRTIYVKR